MDITLAGILKLVGTLSDRSGDDAPQQRFRTFLNDNVKEVGQIRDYISECLRTTGPQYNHALQDLVNLIGSFLGFEVEYGCYQGAAGKIGFDGLWKSPIQPDGFHVVIETKTTEVYAINTATLVGYVDNLISERTIPSWESALGLYVVGRPDPNLKPLENSIVVQKRSDQLRIISVESLLSLAEMMNEYDVRHEDILAVLRPSGPTIDPVVELMARLVAQQIVAQQTVVGPSEIAHIKNSTEAKQEANEDKAPSSEAATSYWLTPVRSDEEESAEETITSLVAQEHIYAFGERTPGRKLIKPGDWICFYSSGNGVVAHARITSLPRNELNPHVRHSERYPWVFDLDSEELYLNDPVIIDAALRTNLDAFNGKDVNKNWAWYVQGTNRIKQHDFNVLTRRHSSN
jgi:hypothetical protein